MDSNGKQKESAVDQWLEAELGRYGHAAPRSGLEMRVLANLQAERNRAAARRRSWRAAGLIVATCAILVVIWLGQADRGRRSPGVPVATHSDEGKRSPQPIAHLPVAKPSTSAGSRTPGPHVTRLPVVLQVDVSAAAPKREQFPTPAPLNEQEQLLARYVREFPEKAALVAQAQTELRQQDEREMSSPWPDQANLTGTEQQE